MTPQLVCIPSDDYVMDLERYGAPIAQEDIRLGEIVFIDYIPDAETFGVFKMFPNFTFTKERMGIALNAAQPGTPCSVVAKGDATQSGITTSLMWAVVKS